MEYLLTRIDPWLLLVIVILVLLVIREVVCWYFKINERRNLLRSILTELRKANGTEEPKTTTQTIMESLRSKKRSQG